MTHKMKIRQQTVHQASACSVHHSTGDIFIVCLTKPFSSLYPRQGTTLWLFRFALMPLGEEGNETDAAIRNWEGVYQSVTDDHQSTFDIVMAWWKGTGNKSKSWTTILTALQTAELGDLAREIQINIEQGTLSPVVKLAHNCMYYMHVHVCVSKCNNWYVCLIVVSDNCIYRMHPTPNRSHAVA